MSILRNFVLALRQPSYLFGFVRYNMSRVTHGGQAVLRLPGGLRLSHFGSYTEYRGLPAAVSDGERQFLESYDFGDGDTLDVGANIGLVTLYIARRFPKRTVHAFEPNPSAYDSLRGNIALNGCDNVRPHHEALSDTNGEIRFLAHERHRATCRIGTAKDQGGIRVPCATLDTVCQREKIGQIAFLKIDVEGFEEDVLRGAAGILRRNPPRLVYYEVCPGYGQLLDKDTMGPTRILQDSGYQIHSIGPDGALVPNAKPSLDGVDLTNWVAVRGERTVQ